MKGDDVSEEIAQLAAQLPSLDIAVLESLPEEGAKMGFNDLAPQVAQITDTLNAKLPEGTPMEARVNGQILNGRVRFLHRMGLITKKVVYPQGRGWGYQRTELGDQILNHVKGVSK